MQEPCENMGVLLGQWLLYEPALLEMHDLCRYSDSIEWIAPPIPLKSSEELTEFSFVRCATVLASVGCENGCMNLATTLKSEISRVARKEVRAELQTLKKTTIKLRSDNAELKRRLSEVEKLVKQIGRGDAKKSTVAASNEEVVAVARFSGKGLAAQRKRLGLSAADFGLLLGVSGASVYLWEKAETRPRASQMPAIAAVRKMKKNNAIEKLAALK